MKLYRCTEKQNKSLLTNSFSNTPIRFLFFLSVSTLVIWPHLVILTFPKKKKLLHPLTTSEAFPFKLDIKYWNFSMSLRLCHFASTPFEKDSWNIRHSFRSPVNTGRGSCFSLKLLLGLLDEIKPRLRLESELIITQSSSIEHAKRANLPNDLNN